MYSHEYQELTPSEKYLTRLCKDTFLNMWAWPHVYRHQKWNGGPGKEVCDLLVVFDSNIIIFSDKHCDFPDTGNTVLDWCRWFKKAIYQSAQQIWGAERWIRQYPDKLFLNKECSRPFPIPLPKTNVAKFHRIVVAHGSYSRSIKELGGSGSLMINPEILNCEHFDSQSYNVLPFTIGRLDEKYGFVHIIDDVTLYVLLKTVDIIIDFVNYLEKKEQLFESGYLGTAAGEEDILAYYLQKVNAQGEHDFVFPKSANKIVLTEGFWKNHLTHPDRIAQLEADKISYSWDKLIDKFSKHILSDTLYHLSSQGDVSDHETGLKFLAREPRVRRRTLSKSLHQIMLRAEEETRSVRVFQSLSPEEPSYVFLALDRPEDKTQEEYRIARQNLLTAYCRTVKVVFPEAVHIVGIATEPLRYVDDRSEDLVYLNASVWSDEDQKEAKEVQNKLNLLKKSRRVEFKESEYPREQIANMQKGRNRNKPCICGSGKKYKKCCIPQ